MNSNGIALATDRLNWSPNGLPGASDDVVFDGTVANNTCPLNYGTPSSTFNSFNLVNGYSGVVTVNTGLMLHNFQMTSGTLNPAGIGSGSFGVDTSFIWTGGVLNSTSFTNVSANVRGSATVTPGTAGLTTGYTLAFQGGSATVNDGKITFTDGAGVTVDGGANVQLVPATQDLLFVNADPATPEVNKVINGMLTVVGPHDWSSQGMGINITGGTFRIDDPCTATVTGHVGSPTGPSVLMSSGSLAIYQRATLAAPNGVNATGGRISTLKSGNYPSASIEGDLTNSGADVIILDGVTQRPLNVNSAQALFGKLIVEGNVNWTGGTYRPGIWSAAGSDTGIFTENWEPDHYADNWSCTGTFTIGGTAKIAPNTVDKQGNVTIGGAPTATGARWIVIQASTALTRAAGTPTVAPPPPPTPNPYTGVSTITTHPTWLTVDT